MSLLDRIKNLIHADRIANWPQDERVALFRLLYAACVADETYTSEEQVWLQGVMKDAGTAWADLHAMELPQAVAHLHKGAAKEAQLYPLLAEALFADGDFDRNEKAFVQRLGEQGLSREKLEAAITRVRDRVLGNALKEWNREIAGSDGSGSAS